MLYRKAFSRTSESALDFVANQHDAVAVADRSQCLHEFERCRDEAAFAENGLDDDSRYAFRLNRARKRLMQRVDCALRGPAVQLVRERRVVDLVAERTEILLVRRIFAGHRKCEKRAAVIAMLK